MAQTPEGKIKDAIKKVLDTHGFWRAGTKKPDQVEGWYYMPVSNGMGVHGIPDFVCCWKGKFFCIEAKASGGTTTANQDARHDEIRAAQGWVLVVNNKEVLEEFLENARHSR